MRKNRVGFHRSSQTGDRELPTFFRVRLRNWISSTQLDASKVDGLIRSKVETIVVEETNSTGIVTGGFPAFERFLDQHFELHRTSGIFNIFEKKPGKPDSP